MGEEFVVKKLLQKYQNDIVILDGFLHWSMNPTAEAAGWGINENTKYIRETLEKTHNLTSDESGEIMQKLQSEYRLLFDNGVPRRLYRFYNQIQSLIETEHFKVFNQFYLKKLKSSGIQISEFLFLFQNKEVFWNKNDSLSDWVSLNVQYNAIFGREVPKRELITFGILKEVLWISSGTTPPYVEYKLVPFLQKFVGGINLAKYRPKSPGISAFIKNLEEEKEFSTLKILKDIYNKRNSLTICQIENTKLTYLPKLSQGIFGSFYEYKPLGPHYFHYYYFGISYMVKEEVFSSVASYIQKEHSENTRKIKEILELEMKLQHFPTRNEILTQTDLTLDDAVRCERLINELPAESFVNDIQIKTFATKAIKQLKPVTFYNLINALGYDVETARKIGKCLLDEKIIPSIPRVPQKRGDQFLNDVYPKEISAGTLQLIVPSPTAQKIADSVKYPVSVLEVAFIVKGEKVSNFNLSHPSHEIYYRIQNNTGNLMRVKIRLDMPTVNKEPDVPVIPLEGRSIFSSDILIGKAIDEGDHGFKIIITDEQDTLLGQVKGEIKFSKSRLKKIVELLWNFVPIVGNLLTPK